jgi:PadR family transcriptional regulator
MAGAYTRRISTGTTNALGRALGLTARRNRSATCHLTQPEASTYIGWVSTVDDLSKLDFLQGTLEVLILRSLALGPNHAYGISQFLKQESDQAFIVDNGSLYPALQRLLQRGWIDGQWKTSPNARRARYYRLTPAGRKQLVVATSKWQRFVEAMGRVLASEG